MSQTRRWRIVIVPAAAVLSLAAGPPAYEPAPAFKASQILPANLAKGPHHWVAEEVRADGYYQLFHVTSDFGELEAEGRTVFAHASGGGRRPRAPV